MGIVVYTADLVLQSQLRAAGQRVGAALDVAATDDALLTTAKETQPRLVVLDLSLPGLDAARLVPRLKALAPTATVLAFGPHVHRERLAAASAAGCDVVKSRGAFHAEMETILRRFSG